MSTSTIPNLDYIAAAAGGRISAAIGEDCIKNKKRAKTEAKDVDNLVTKALGVVQESGPFACGLFLLSRTGTAADVKQLAAEHVAARRALCELLLLPAESTFAGIQTPWKQRALSPERVGAIKREIVEHLVQLAGVEIDRLMLVKQVWEQALTYARYMARSQKKD